MAEYIPMAPSQTGPPYVRVAGPKNSGKTCLIEALLRELTARGLRIGTIKHDAHQFEIDNPGKDTWRHRQAGSVATVICSGTKLALMRDMQDAPPVSELVERYLPDCDLVLVEGYKSDRGPVIALGGITVAGEVLASLPNGYSLSEEQVTELADRLAQLAVTTD